MMVTLVLSSNMKRMLKNHVLVRKLVGIETAGSLNILFTDKTGTLTKGKLEVENVLLGNGHVYRDFRDTSFLYQRVFSNSLIYNNESSYDDSSGEIVGGNSTDRAILDYVKVRRRDDVRIISSVLFDSSRKYSKVNVLDGGVEFCYVKGAYEVLLNRCDYFLDEDGTKKLLLHKDKLVQKIEEASSGGVRVLCVAYREGVSTSLDDHFVLVGLLLMRDEVRAESIEGVKLIQNAGIQVVMVTGDYRGTAISIAKEVGILRDDSDIVLDSEELMKLSDEEVCQLLPKIRVVARAMPNDKSRLVNLAKKSNLVVGMTGDGVNDSIALKRADVGFSLGSGTEVSKEASDIVIMDDNILSIERAILYGRTIFKSIRKFIIFQLTVNFCAVSISIVGPFIGIPSPITVIQMLWINMVMDTLSGLAFSYEPALMEYMEELPKKRDEKIINSYMLNEIVVIGIYSFFLSVFFLKSDFISRLFRYSYSNQYVMTAFFGLFIFMSIFNSFNARTVRLNILRDIFNNKVFLVIILFVFIVQVLMIYYGGSLFRTTGLNFSEFLITICLAFSVIPVDMLRKIIWKRRKGDCGV